MSYLGGSIIAYLFDPATRFFTGGSEGVPGDVLGSRIFPPNACFEPPPDNMPEGTAARRNIGNTAWEVFTKPSQSTIAEEKRRSAYESHADPVKAQADNYKGEYEAFLELDRHDGTEDARTRWLDKLSEWLEIKEKIRQEYPYEEGVESKT